MANEVTISKPLQAMASRLDIDPEQLQSTLMRTVMPTGNNVPAPTLEQFTAFLMVANEYNLNPLTKEIYAFPAKGKGIVPIVPIDGWTNIINSNPQFDGMEFDDVFDENKKIVSITCKIHRKDRKHPVEVTEYLSECAKGTEPWKQWPVRMLRHKAVIQCARYAFGLSGIVDQDEADRIASVDNDAPTERVVEGEIIHPDYPADRFEKNLPKWKERIAAGKDTLENVKATIKTSFTLTDQQAADLDSMVATLANG